MAPPDVPAPDAVVVRNAEYVAVMDALERLRPRDRELPRLAIWDELPHADIGTILGCSAHAVDQRLYRATRKMARELHATGHKQDKTMMAPGARHYCPGSGSDGVSGDDLAAFVDKGFSVADIQPIGTISMGTPGDSSDASEDHVIVTQLTLNGHEGYVSVLHLRGPEDDLEVLSHRAFP